MPYCSASELAFSKDQLVIGFTDGSLGGGHIGIAFHSAKEGMKLLHLCAHLRLQTDDFPPNSPEFWVATIVELPSAASKQLVAIIRAISKRLPKINYGLNFLAASGSFDAQGHYKAPKGSDGLTCATFVSTVFRDLRCPLILETTWKPEPKNIEWGEAVYAWLVNSKADPTHLAAVKGNIVGLRIRPDEVAAAADIERKDRPVIFEVASANAPLVQQALKLAARQSGTTERLSASMGKQTTISSGQNPTD